MHELLGRLTKAFGPSSKEDRVKTLIKEELKAYEPQEDKLGNLVYHFSHSGPKLMLSAHLDTIGVIVTDVDKNGFIRFAPVGGLREVSIFGSDILFESGVRGIVFCEDSVALQDKKELKMNKLFIDIGAKSKKEALNYVNIGMEGIFYPNFSLLDGRAISPSMDDRSGCTVLVELIKNLKVKSLLYDLYVVFTAQEEIGVKGARTSAYDITPDLGIAIDVTSCFDYLEPRMSAVELGKGPAVKVMDGGMITNMELRSKIIEVAEKNKIPYQLDVKTGGATDAMAMQVSKDGVKAGVISIPTRYVHSKGEVVDLSDLKNTVVLLKSFIEK